MTRPGSVNSSLWTRGWHTHRWLNTVPELCPLGGLRKYDVVNGHHQVISPVLQGGRGLARSRPAAHDCNNELGKTANHSPSPLFPHWAPEMCSSFVVWLAGKGEKDGYPKILQIKGRFLPWNWTLASSLSRKVQRWIRPRTLCLPDTVVYPLPSPNISPPVDYIWKTTPRSDRRQQWRRPVKIFNLGVTINLLSLGLKVALFNTSPFPSHSVLFGFGLWDPHGSWGAHKWRDI